MQLHVFFSIDYFLFLLLLLQRWLSVLQSNYNAPYYYFLLGYNI